MAFKDEWLIHKVTGLLGITNGQITAFRFQRQQYLADAKRFIAQVMAKSPQYFRRLPKAELEVRAVETWRQ